MWILFWLCHAVFLFFIYCCLANNTPYIFFTHFLYYVLWLQRCYEGGREVIVIPKTSASSDNPWFGLAKYAWSGYVNASAHTHTHTHTRAPLLPFTQQSHVVSIPPPLSYVLECASCGVIYRSRQYWMGNQDPESSVVRSEIKHVWEGVSIPPVFSASTF